MNRTPEQWPVKPDNAKWTDEQWAAIAAEGSHLLVAAAAGSGKTAVLVERMIKRIADPDRPLEVDALLVATFTKAAAAEMKERIRRALEEALERTPDSRHLERQLALLPRAAITTLHSFCKEVVERYAPLIGLDPGFRLASDTEAELLRMDTLDELFEETYEREGTSGALSRLADRFGGERSDEPLHRLILELHAFAGSHPWPEHWLTEAAARYRDADAAGLLTSLWIRSLLGDTRLQLSGAFRMLEAALRLCGDPGGPAPYAAALQEDLSAVGRVLAALEKDSWSGWQEAFASCTFGRLKPCRGDDYDPELQEKVKAYRDTAKKTIAKLHEEWLVRSPERYAEEMRELAPDMEALAALTVQFGQRYETAKRAKGLLDFGDLEHYALRILRDPASTPDRAAPSAAATDFRNRFAEIYLDEYQDTNEVQEAIVSLIARRDPGNVFMVGDVKQSIYRFRLAEPGLFMDKYRRYDIWEPALPDSECPEGLRIDLARNFRSRREIVDAVNHVFRLIMREPVGEMNYDRRAELVYGQGYPATAGPEAGASDGWGVELLLLDAAAAGAPDAAEAVEASPASEASVSEEHDADAAGETEVELESAQAEARCVTEEIRRLLGQDREGGVPFSVYEGRSGIYRPVQFRDIVILLRATSVLAPIYLEELKAAGIPAYADLATGYFAATEVDVMLSLLAIIDNPRQDIPLAGVLRSPIVGLSADDLARIRLCDRRGQFWDAVQAAAAQTDSRTPETVENDPRSSDAAQNELRMLDTTEAGLQTPDTARTDPQAPETVQNVPMPPRVRRTVAAFVAQLSRWRDFARREPLGDLLWTIYRETGYYDFVGGLPGGSQRQANLRALIDRARGYEQSSRFRGLFRFLRFLGRMRDSGADLGAARALGEGENVVRIVSIHKSKGLEFPVVFAAGLGRGFNRRDLNGMFLKHKSLGFGPRMVELDSRVAYPTLPQLAIRKRLAAEMLAEEMRVLYVALTRPKEKLILVGTVKDAAKQWDKWRETAAQSESGLPDYAIAAASCYLDWIGPAAVLAESDAEDQVKWSSRVVPLQQLARQPAPVLPGAGDLEGEAAAAVRHALIEGEPVNVQDDESDRRVRAVLSWRYPGEEATKLSAKTSITAWKNRLFEAAAEAGDGGDRVLLPEAEAGIDARDALARLTEAALGGDDDDDELTREAEAEAWSDDRTAVVSPVLTYRLRRPRFIAQSKLTPAERGTAFHLVMQHLPLQAGTDEADVERLLDDMVERRLLFPEQRAAVGAGEIAAFCRTGLFDRMCKADRVWREIPFTYGVPASVVYPGAASGLADEAAVIQGVVDCLVEEEDGLVLIDYKTDMLKGGSAETAAEKHRFQVEKYGEAIERIVGRPVREAYVYFFDGGHAVGLWKRIGMHEGLS